MATVETPRMLTPPQVAKRLGVSAEKIVNWIRSGELLAIDVAVRGSQRPRFRVDPIDLAVFLDQRAVTTAPKASRRRRQNPAVTEYF